VKLLSESGKESSMMLVERWGAESENEIASTSTGSQTGDGERLYVEPLPPAPTGITAHVYEGTIDPVEPLRYPELAKLLPASQPFDTRFVSVEASFDAAALREILKGETADRDPLPASWWTGRTEIFDVELIRERLLAGGEYGEETVISTLPGRFSMRERIRDAKQAPKDLTDMLERERSNRDAIRRPAFYSMIAGTAWVKPVIAAASSTTTARPPRVDQLVREVENIDREIKRREDQLNPPQPGGAPSSGSGTQGGGGGDRDGPPPPSDESRADAAGGFRWPEIPSTWLAQSGGRPGSGGPGGGRDGPSPEEERATREERRRKALEDDIARFKTQRERAVKSLQDLGFDDKGQRIVAPRPTDQPTAAPSESVLSLLDQTATSIGIWAHDITAKPGETYRYKMRVWITNPFFGNATALTDAQKELASVAGLAGAESEWTADVTIAPATQYFVTSAREGGLGIGGVGRSDSAADVEVYEFFYGYWRRGTGKLEPGDQVRAEITVPELPLFAVKLDEKGAAVVEASGTTPTSRVVAAPTYFLGVARQSGQGDVEVFVRETNGLVGIRWPSADAASPTLAKLASSFEASGSAVVSNPAAGGGSGGAPSSGSGGVPSGGSDDRDGGDRGGSGLPGG